MSVAADGRNDLIPQRGKSKPMSQALDQNESGAGYRFGRGQAVFDGHQWIAGAVYHQRRGGSPEQAYPVRLPEAMIAAI